MNNYVNPPCNGSLATSLNIANIECNWGRGRDNITVWWECRQWRARAGNWRECSKEQCSPQFAICQRFGCGRDRSEGEECVRRALEEFEASDSRTEEASGGDSFVDIMGSLEKETGGESEGFVFEDILQRADLLSETVLEGVVDAPELPLC